MRISYGKGFIIAFITLLGAIAYSNSFSNSFHYLDDINSIIDNISIRNIQNLRDIWNYWPTRFVTYLSIALNYRLCGFDVFGYHIFNFMTHLFSAVSLWWLALLTFDTPLMKKDTIKAHAPTIAFFTSAVFLLHPIQTQPVNYIIQRAVLLAALFYITSVALYARARLKLDSKPKSRVWKAYYFGSVLSAAMSFFSKEMAVSLPVTICLYEFCFFKVKLHGLTAAASSTSGFLLPWSGIPPEGHSPINSPVWPSGCGTKKSSAWKYVMAFPIMIIASLLMVVATKSTNFIEMCSIGTARAGISIGHYFLTELKVIITYLRLVFMPVNQNFDYDYPAATSLFSVPVISSLLLILMILVAAVKILKKYRLISFCIFWFFITLLPESSIVPIRDVIFEHRLYLPLAGFSLFLVSGLYYLFKGRRSNVTVAVLFLIIVSYAVMTYDRNKVWESELTLWNDTVLKSPNKARPYNNRGNAYGEKGNHDRALSDFDKAIQLKPDYAEAYYNRSVAYFYKGDYERSRENARKAEILGYKVNPDFLNDLRRSSAGGRN